MTSIRRFLLLWLLGAVAGAALVLAAGYYGFAFDEVNEVFDRQLKQLARTVLAVHTEVDHRQLQPAVPATEKFHRGFVTQVWAANGKLLFNSVNSPVLPLLSAPGLHTLDVDHAQWRVYTLRAPLVTVQAAQSMTTRSALAKELASKLLFPGLVAISLMAAVLAYALKRGLQPLATAAAAVEGRSVLALEDIPQHGAPLEVQPLIKAINTLMAHLSDALAKQRQFTADAAHGLRTPLAALRLQFELLEASLHQASQREMVGDIRGGLDRAVHMVAQLLDLSRVEPASVDWQPVSVDLAGLACVAVGDFSLRAEQAGLDLGADAPQPVQIKGSPQQLRLLIDNLIDNAVRYTTAHGRIDVRVWRDLVSRESCLEVIDSGPGLSFEQRARAFDRFYRAAELADEGNFPIGAGLGLAIAKEVAERHGATIELDDGLPNANLGKGLTVRVRFSAAAAAAGVPSSLSST